MNAPARLVVVVGPTAAGKSDLALALAEAAGVSVLCADSQQVYVGMDIGTNKPSAAERARVAHHGLDLVRPDEPMSAQRWVAVADRAIADAAARGQGMVVCGGTGLYVRALLYGLFAGPPADPALRARLEAEPRPVLHARLAVVDPVAAARIDPNDQVRLIRALEVHALTGEPISAHQARHDYGKVPARYAAKVVGLGPDRDALGERIDARVDAMIARGWVDEVRALLARGFAPELRAMGAIGYRELAAHVAGTTSLDEASLAIKRATRRYARRQRGWFRAEREVSWYQSGAAVDSAALVAFLAGA